MDDDAYRIERDSMGEMRVPGKAYYGTQTARALENFPVSGLRFSRCFIRSLGRVKQQAAWVNARLGRIDEQRAEAIAEASAEVVEGKWDEQFVVDIFQTGSGTSTNMNANEVIARRATELLGEGLQVHPNDHVNLGQSSNDVIPTAIHLSAMESLAGDLVPALLALEASLREKEKAFARTLKLGRTHLQDATPMWLGQEFGGYATQVQHGTRRIEGTYGRLGELALGGTAVGTGLNGHPEFAEQVIEGLRQATGLPLRQCRDHFEAQAARDACVEASGALRCLAVSLNKIANDIRFLASGPRCGLGELELEATQPGSSIMPGKVNPVMCEMLMQVSAQIVGNDATIAFAGSQGNFELNVMMPVIAYNLLQSIELLASGASIFERRCIQGLKVNEERCEAYATNSLMLCTALAPEIGYDEAARLAKKAHASGQTIMKVALEETDLTAERLETLLDPRNQIPG